MSRPFSQREKQLLQHLATQGQNADILMAQIQAAQNDAAWFAGSQSFDIVTDTNVPPYWSGEDIGGGRQIGSGCTVRIDGSLPDSETNYIGEVFRWIVDGRLSALEYSWVTEDMPIELPRLEQLAI